MALCVEGGRCVTCFTVVSRPTKCIVDLLKSTRLFAVPPILPARLATASDDVRCALCLLMVSCYADSIVVNQILHDVDG